MNRKSFQSRGFFEKIVSVVTCDAEITITGMVKRTIQSREILSCRRVEAIHGAGNSRRKGRRREYIR